MFEFLFQLITKTFSSDLYPTCTKTHWGTALPIIYAQVWVSWQKIRIFENVKVLCLSFWLVTDYRKLNTFTLFEHYVGMTGTDLIFSIQLYLIELKLLPITSILLMLSSSNFTHLFTITRATTWRRVITLSVFLTKLCPFIDLRN